MSDHKILVEVVTPYALFYKDDVDMVIFRAKDGEVGILPGHAPLMAALVSGEVRIKINDKWLTIAATNGYAEVGPEICLIIVNAAEYPKDIDIERARRALDRAEQKLSDPDTSRQEISHAKHAAERARNRIKVAEKYRNEQRKKPGIDSGLWT